MSDSCMWEAKEKRKWGIFRIAVCGKPRGNPTGF